MYTDFLIISLYMSHISSDYDALVRSPKGAILLSWDAHSHHIMAQTQQIKSYFHLGWSYHETNERFLEVFENYYKPSFTY